MNHGIILVIFALLSEVPYDLMYGSLWDLARQNVLITLFIGYMMIWMLDSISKFRISYPDKVLQKIGAARLNTLIELVVMLVGFAMAYFINCSYSYAGIMIILCFYAVSYTHLDVYKRQSEYCVSQSTITSSQSKSFVLSLGKYD